MLLRGKFGVGDSKWLAQWKEQSEDAQPSMCIFLSNSNPVSSCKGGWGKWGCADACVTETSTRLKKRQALLSAAGMFKLSPVWCPCSNIPESKVGMLHYRLMLTIQSCLKFHKLNAQSSQRQAPLQTSAPGRAMLVSDQLITNSVLTVLSRVGNRVLLAHRTQACTILTTRILSLRMQSSNGQIKQLRKGWGVSQTWVSLCLYITFLDNEYEPQISFECQCPQNCEFLCTGVKDLSKTNTGHSVDRKSKMVPGGHFVTLHNCII